MRDRAEKAVAGAFELHGAALLGRPLERVTAAVDFYIDELLPGAWVADRDDA
jgi:hypothetical protein